MSKSAGGGSSGGASSKARSGGGKGRAITKTKEMKTTKAGADQIVYLRGAIYDDHGNDRNVLESLAAFTTLRLAATGAMEEEELTISFSTGKTVPRDEVKFMFNLSKSTMEEIYDESEYGWDDDDKRSELRDPATRHILARTASGELVGFASFQLTLQGEMYEKPIGLACVFVREMQVVEKYQRRGVGRHLARLMEMVGMKYNIAYVEYLVMSTNEAGHNFIENKLKGYSTDGREELLMQLDGDWDDDTFIIYSKVVSRELRMAAQIAAKRIAEANKLSKQLAAALQAGVQITTDSTGKLTTTPVKSLETESAESPTSVLDAAVQSAKQ